MSSTTHSLPLLIPNAPFLPSSPILLPPSLPVLAPAILLFVALSFLVLRLRTSYLNQQSKSRRLSEKSVEGIEGDVKRGLRREQGEQGGKEDGKEGYAAAFPCLDPPMATGDEREQIRTDKELYHRLQNLETYPDAIALACTRLSTLFDQTIHSALASPAGSILDVQPYSPSALKAHFDRAHSATSHKYEAYLARRREGGPRELFPSREFAVQWLRLAGPVKYVDGGWIASILGLHTGPVLSTRSTSATSLSASASESGSASGSASAPDSAPATESCTVPGAASGNGEFPSGPERRAAKLAWQVISEEFGDGDLAKNHVLVYNDLLAKLDSTGSAMTGDQRGFDGLDSDGGSPRCWTAAIAQQCIGVLSSTDAYFPEALGFNMAYETLAYHLLLTSRELRELLVDDYYFALHITIDNPDSGHAALARVAVERYLDGVRERDGIAAMEHAWKRVQAGVILADGLPTTPCSPVEFTFNTLTQKWAPPPIATPSPDPPTSIESRMVSLIHRKTSAAEKMHCPSRVRINGRTIEQWLAPKTFTPDLGLEFLRALAEKRIWVVPGDTSKSRLVRELEWGGRMFGAFSGRETDLVRRWVEEIGEVGKQEGAYEAFVGRAFYLPPAVAQEGEESTKGRSRFARYAKDQYLSVPDTEIAEIMARFPSPHPTTPLDLMASLPIPFKRRPFDSPTFAARWYSHLSLLELFPLSPSRFASPLGSCVLRILRAHLGFPALHAVHDICAGMDGVHPFDGDDEDEFGAGPVDMVGLWEIGHRVLRSEGYELPPTFGEMARGIEAYSSDSDLSGQRENALDLELCADMLALRTRPYGAQATLLGMTLAFTRLYTSELGGRLTEEEEGMVSRITADVELSIEEYLAIRREGEAGGSEEEKRWGDGFVRGYRRVLEM